MKYDLARLVMRMSELREASYQPGVWTDDAEAGRLLTTGGFYHIWYREAAEQAAAELRIDQDLIPVATLMSAYIGEAIEWATAVLAQEAIKLHP